MKKFLLVFLLIGGLLQGCAPSEPQNPAPQEQPHPPATTQPEQTPDTSGTTPSTPPASTPETKTPEQPTGKSSDQSAPSYENDIFKDVTVTKVNEETYEVKGKARVFEAVLNYSVEDGHNELTKGSAQTSAGAPEWGDFAFTLKVKKATANSTLTLILFESSPKDGSRRMELPIPLP